MHSGSNISLINEQPFVGGITYVHDVSYLERWQ